MKNFIRAAYIRSFRDLAKLSFDGFMFSILYFRPNGAKNAAVCYDMGDDLYSWVEYFDENGVKAT